MPSPSELPTLPVMGMERAELLDFSSALQCEWLVTNGLGGYASSTVLGVDTRRYHGLLVAALRPPVERTLLLARVHDTVEVRGDRYPLHTAEYQDGTIHPVGYLWLEDFLLHGTVPSWRFRWRDAELEKTIWLPHGRNTAFIRYVLHDGSEPVRLHLEPFVTHRDYHDQTHGDPAWWFAIDPSADRCRVVAFPGATPLWLRVEGGRFVPTGIWYWHFLHRVERERGLDDVEDLYTPGIFDVDLAPGQEATLVATIHPEDLRLDPVSGYREELRRQRDLLQSAGESDKDLVRRHLVLAADQFLVARGEDERTIIAGYHWFTDWGRDTMISLPGLCLATGRSDEGRQILRSYARYLDQGMLPNRFPDHGEAPEYNTVDATLWYFEAIARYERATGDHALVDELLPRLEDVIAWHERGTRHGIVVDPRDGLLRAGTPDVALTWMDAKVGDWVVKPRQGKAVEIQALWYNALRLLAAWLQERDRDAAPLRDLAERCRASFNARFWNDALACCYDVVDAPGGDDAALRPNQLLAASLSHPVLDTARWEPMLGSVESALLTPVGLRSLAPGSPGYVGTYRGDQLRRDSAYHQGTVWPWLIGPYVDVARRVRGAAWDARPALVGLLEYLTGAGLGQVPEIFGGDPPHPPAGCIAQAWSVAELLRV